MSYKSMGRRLAVLEAEAARKRMEEAAKEMAKQSQQPGTGTPGEQRERWRECGSWTATAPPCPVA